MLYDVFICHASEDKDTFVRPLAEALLSENVAVWYDEFTLRLGDSIRRSIDRGLKQSRFGVVVLSHAFFSKNWPQYELDGLAEREMKGRDKVLLPIWHGVTHDDVISYSPSLGGRRAVATNEGIQRVVDAILEVVHPQGSPLVAARDALIEWGLTPPAITDKYWLEVVEASNRLPGFGAAIPEESSWDRWSFPLPAREDNAKSWGERITWTAMQLNWVKTAEKIPISPLTPPDTVLQFINGHPGLFEACRAFPDLAAEYSPQLTIPGMGGDLENLFEEEYQKSLRDHWAKRQQNSREGSALTTDSACPLCDVEWGLRHSRFGNYGSNYIAEAYFSGGMFGPRVSPFHNMDHAVWLLSGVSNWLPKKIHDYLLDGLTHLVSWNWGPLVGGYDIDGNWASHGALHRQMFECASKKQSFTWTEEGKDDALNRIKLSVSTLSLRESPEELFDRFVRRRFAENYLAGLRKLPQYRSAKSSAKTNIRSQKEQGSAKR